MNTKLLSSVVLFSIVGGYADTLPTVYVIERTTPTNIFSQKVTQKQKELLLEGNGDIGSMLKLNPNIKVENKSTDIDGITDITPSKIEINGARFYQNSIVIDGISNDSKLDPVNSSKYSIYDVPGNENSMFIDLDLIEEINVYDSNISAKYGNFNGGVIDAITKRPKFERESKINFRHTSDKFVKFHSKKESDVTKESYGEDLRVPNNFKKSFLSLYHNEPLNEKSAILGTYSYKGSTVPKKYFSSFKDEEQESHNFLLKYSYFFEDDSIIDVIGTYSSFENNLFRNMTKNSDFTNTGGGANLKVNYEKDFDFWSLNTTASLGMSENSRENSATDYMGWIRLGEKNWGADQILGTPHSYEGGFGNIKKITNELSLNNELKSKDFEVLGMQNQLLTGIQLSYSDANYKRDIDSYRYYSPIQRIDLKCNGDKYTCDDGKQFFSERQKYKAEDVNADITTIGLYIEDIIKYKNLTFQPGVRLDYNNYLENIDLAHRLNASFDLFNDNKTIFLAGVNRYYEKSFLGFKLREARTPYSTEYRTVYQNVLQDWTTSAGKDSNIYIYKDLETPYSDELSFGLKQDIYQGNIFKIKYVKRDYKSQFKEEKGKWQQYTRPDGQLAYYEPISVTNNGWRKYDQITVSLYNQDAISLGNANFFYDLSTAFNQKNKSNFDTYDYEDDEVVNRTDVIYDGKVIDRSDLPTFKNPREYKLFLGVSDIDYSIFDYNAKLSFSGIFTYYEKSEGLNVSDTPMTAEKDLPNGGKTTVEAKSYSKTNYKDLFTLDLKLNAYFPITKKQTLDTTIEVLNVFDKIDDRQYQTNNYSMGRQFWFNVAYRF
ncbi:hypothetical protein CRU92_03970 [Arcobacter sp. FW59]|nr:hypothetical protein CRU92_03970 [Arcobacter sp. FW59]